MNRPSWFPVAWSPTSLAGLETCPRRWALRRAGWHRKPDPLRPAAPHADFGRLWHAAAEQFDWFRYHHSTIEKATEHVIGSVLDMTWQDGEPWAGAALDLWTCRDGIKRNAKGGVSKYLCDGARDWWLGAPASCPKCAGPVEIEHRYVPHHPTKNRETLLRAVEAYCASAAGFDVAGDADGPLLERELHFDVAGVPCHMIVDRLSLLGSRRLGHERKTTGRHPTKAYWDTLARTYQSVFYTIAAGVRDIIYEAVTVSDRGCEVMRQIVSPSGDVVREATMQLDVMDERAGEIFSLRGPDPLDWPGRFTSCATAAGGQPCEFLSLCNAAAAARPHRLTSDFICEPRDRVEP